MRARGAGRTARAGLAAALAGGALVALACLPQATPSARLTVPSATRPVGSQPSSAAAGSPSRAGKVPLEVASAQTAGAALPSASGKPTSAPTTGGTSGSTSGSDGGGTGSLAHSAGRRSAGGGVFLPQGSCAAHPSSGSWVQVSCDSADALARVLARYPGGGPRSASCPSGTDYALSLSTVWSDGRSEPDGTACLRNLRPPHPSDPGQGGGLDIVVGDCLYSTGGSGVRETACDGSGGVQPQYRVIAVVPLGQLLCPLLTQLLITIQNPGQPQQTACAIRL
jgi:hypothetical protein